MAFEYDLENKIDEHIEMPFKSDFQSDKPSSRNVHRAEAKDCWITAAAWNGSGYGDSFEIGIRRKSDGEFWLVQASWTEKGVVKAADAILLMLNAGYAPDKMHEVFP